MGKGGSTSSTVAVPEYIEDAARRNLTEADKIRRLGFIPEYGPTVAAFTPTQEAAFQGTAQAAGAFGLPGGGMSMQDISGGMPEPTTYAGGVRGYSALPIYEQALEAFGQARPGQKQYIDSFFIDPFTGLPGSNMQDPVDYTVASTPGDLGGIGAGGGGGDDGAYFPPVVPSVDVISDQQIADRIADNRAGVDAIITAGDGSIAPVPNILDASQSDDLYNQYFQENLKAAQEHAEDQPYGQTTGVPLSEQGFTTGASLLPPAPAPTYTSQPTQEQLDYAKTSLDPFGGAGPDVTSGPIAGLVSGGGADGVGNFGQVGDFFGGLLGGLNVTGPVTPKSAAELQFEADRAPGGIHYESSGSRRNELAAAAAVKAKDDALAQSVDTSEVLNLAKSKDSAQQWLKENGYGNYDKDDATDVLRSKVADIEKSQLQQGLKDGVVMENDRYSVYVNGQLVSSEKRSSEAKAKLKAATS